MRPIGSILLVIVRIPRGSVRTRSSRLFPYGVEIVSGAALQPVPVDLIRVEATMQVVTHLTFGRKCGHLSSRTWTSGASAAIVVMYLVFGSKCGHLYSHWRRRPRRHPVAVDATTVDATGIVGASSHEAYCTVCP